MTRIFLFILCLVSGDGAFYRAHANEVCAAPASPSLSSLKETLQYTIFSKNECSGLKSLWENREVLLNKPSDEIIRDAITFEQEFIKCHEGLYNSCYRDEKPIDEALLDELFKKWKTDPHLNMPRPLGMCVQRSIILAEKIRLLGFGVEIASFESLSIVGLYTYNGKLEYEEYSPPDREDRGRHYVVSVYVKTPNGNLERRILDPQFAETPMSLEEYSKLITGSTCSEKPQRPTECHVQFRKPISYDFMQYSDYVYFLKGNLTLTDPCGWTLVKPSIREIEYQTERNESRLVRHVPQYLAKKPPQEIIQKLTMGNIQKRIEILESKYFEGASLSQEELQRSRKLIEDLQKELSIREH